VKRGDDGLRAWTQRAQEIRARANREVTVLVANATRQSEQIRGEGDGQRNKIFADAFNQDRDFFAFYRSMQALEAGLKPADTRLLLRPDSEFFRFFGNPSGKPRSGATSPAEPTTASGSAANPTSTSATAAPPPASPTTPVPASPSTQQ